MTTDDIEKLYGLFQRMSMNRSEERDFHAYNNMNSEVAYYTKFASWIKQTYPDVWEAWKAWEDLQNSTKTEIGMQSGWNR
jgi:hypothetical protein